MDGRIREAEIGELKRHLTRCSDCTLHYHQLRNLRASLRTLPARRAPEKLETNLRVIASQQQALRQRHATVSSNVRYWSDIAHLWLNNLMRPVALPFAGGLLSAVFLFSMMAPMYSAIDPTVKDVPTSLTTTAGLKRLPVAFGIDRDVVVEVYVDGEGRLLDYSVPPGQIWQHDPELKRCVENTLLCTQFEPATMFGLPKSGKVHITLCKKQVDVRG